MGPGKGLPSAGGLWVHRTSFGRWHRHWRPKSHEDAGEDHVWQQAPGVRPIGGPHRARGSRAGARHQVYCGWDGSGASSSARAGSHQRDPGPYGAVTARLRGGPQRQPGNRPSLGTGKERAGRTDAAPSRGGGASSRGTTHEGAGQKAGPSIRCVKAGGCSGRLRTRGARGRRARPASYTRVHLPRVPGRPSPPSRRTCGRGEGGGRGVSLRSGAREGERGRFQT